MNKPEVSVIIPVYNAEKHIKKCVNSVLNQTYKNFEIILVNDGSTDNSGEICREFAQNDSRVVFVNKVNGGVSSARNSGIDIARSKYIMFVDSDDFVDPEIIEVLLGLIKEKNTDLAISGIRRISQSKNKTYSVAYLMNDKTYNLNSFIEALTVEFASNSLYSPFCKIFLKEIVDKHKVRFDEKIGFCEDVLFVMQYLERCSTIASTSRILYSYSKDNDESITNKYIENAYEIANGVYGKVRGIYLNNSYSDLAISNFEYLYFYRLLNCIKMDFVFRKRTTFQHRMISIKNFLNDKYVVNSICKIRPKGFAEKILFLIVKNKLSWLLYFVIAVKFRNLKSYWFPKWRLMK